MKKALTILVFMVSGAFSAYATPQDYAKFYEVDLDAPLPSLEELNEKYAKPNVLYDRRYDYGWNIGYVFDEVFRLTINEHGSSEKRLKTESEEALLDLLESIPKEMYEYVGPYMHTVPGISDKILNMPGIKETKNKFPSRIAPQLAHIEDLEFLSPSLYFILMPEAWPQKMEVLEIKKTYATAPKVVFDEKFYETLKKIVKPEDYMPGATPVKKVSRSDLRTLRPGKDTLLTSADVKAFISTLDDLDAFAKRDDNMLSLYNIGLLFGQYERDQGNGLMVNEIKDMVNPCSRLVQKIKIAGKRKEEEFTKIVGKAGFDIKEWAYTCEKTIKAYRVATVSMETIQGIKAYEKGIYDKAVKHFNPRMSAMQFATMQGVVEMYKAPLSDVLEVRKSRKELSDKILKMENRLVASPLESLG